MNKRWIAGFFFMLLIATAVVCQGAPKRNKTALIDVNGHDLSVELAITQEEQMTGLMNRDALGSDEGMLFIFPQEQILSFWMKNTLIPLSIAFIKIDGRIVQIDSMKPYSLDSHFSREKVKYALEMNEGWFTKHGVDAGDLVRIPLTLNGRRENE
ncbi:MAG TPA: DUF192 domain-containing protein [Candidatus Brocadiaceae bacterium]|nr:DUF192 domain-containing protein [Candidatus Brocadiaceae bacterium]